MPLIEATDLVKIYRTAIKQPGVRGALRGLVRTEWKETAAIDGVTFTMDEGESMACIGENGAGKSTLIKMLVGILSPTGGTARVYGDDPMAHHTAYLRKIGVVFGQKTNLWWDIPVIESYHAVQVLYRLDKAAFQKTMDAVVDLLGLAPILTSPARKLSLGQRMKADIGMVFLHSPRALYLDEPTIGLDINVKHTIRQFIRQMNRETGVSVLLTSHDLDDIDQICDTALVLAKGRVYYRGALGELSRRFAARKVVIIAGGATGDITALLPMAEVAVEGRKTRVAYDQSAYTSQEVLAAVSACYDIEDITIQEPGIDYVVSQIFAQGAGRGRDFLRNPLMATDSSNPRRRL